MEARLLSSLGKIAGIGGIALGVFVLLFQGVLQKDFLPRAGLGSGQAFAVIIALMILTFGIASIGIIAWLVSRNISPRFPVSTTALSTLSVLIAAVLGSTVYVAAQATPDAPPPSDRQIGTPQQQVQSATERSASAVPIADSQYVWPTNTGDVVIDNIDGRLNQLPTGSSEGALAQILGELFSYPVFFDLREADSFSEALYVYCRSQIILEHYLGYFQDPNERDNLSKATQNLIYLQDQLGHSYGAIFNRSDVCRNHNATLKNYRDNLPPRNTSGADVDLGLATRTLETLKQNLAAVETQKLLSCPEHLYEFSDPWHGPSTPPGWVRFGRI